MQEVITLNLSKMRKMPVDGKCAECDNSDMVIVPRLDETTNEIVPDYAICLNCGTEYEIPEFTQKPQLSNSVPPI